MRLFHFCFQAPFFVKKQVWKWDLILWGRDVSLPLLVCLPATEVDASGPSSTIRVSLERPEERGLVWAFCHVSNDHHIRMWSSKNGCGAVSPDYIWAYHFIAKLKLLSYFLSDWHLHRTWHNENCSQCHVLFRLITNCGILLKI